MSIIIIMAFAVLIYTSMQSISNSQELRLEVVKQTLEMKYMNEYAKETTRQYNEIRKFKHDYVNILSSLDYFIQLKDMDKLSHCYQEVIRPTQELLDTNSFNFKELSNIKSDELKSILAIKVLLAKDQGVLVQMEVPDVISDNLPVDFVVLIRMIGILFDNSIEEVVHIPDGKIEVGLFSLDDNYLFVIKNPIRDNTLSLHQLEVEGFSTKDDNRGLGLSNLRELSKREKHLMLETSMTDKHFIQKIIINSGGKKMVPIFICEDDAIQRHRLEDIIKKYVMIEDYDMEIVLSTDSPNDLLQYVDEHRDVRGLYFLDIDLGQEMNGVG